MKSARIWQAVFFLGIFFCAGYWFVLKQSKPSGVHEAASRRVQNVTEYRQMNQQNLQAIIRDNNVSEIDQLIPLLPKKFLSNFTIKHGLMNLGPRGHLAEGDVNGLGLHSEPLAPRTFVFDTATGFVISYNGGKKHDGTPQEGGQTLDTMSFDFNSKTFQLSKIDFPLRVAGQAQPNSNTCTLCHGDNNRPIFSMYPDWPRFYGSDNDELKLGEGNPSAINGVRDTITRRRFEVQAEERRYFHEFRNSVVPQHPRYAPLFDPAAYGIHRFPVSNSQYPEYPYRSDVEQLGESLDASAVSRSFTRRAGLRFNLLYSRLLVQQVVDKIKKHPRFPTYGKFFVYNIMRCGIEAQPNRGTQIMQTWSAPLQRTLTEVQSSRRIEHKVWNEYATADSERLVHDSYFTLPNGQLTVLDGKLLRYDQNLALFDLKLNDVDMRFTYYHPAYLPKNAFKDNKKLCEDSDADCSAHVMSVGYLQKWYFNSYNDGSTTMDEHLTAELLKVLAESDSSLAQILRQRGAYAIRGLLNKYSGSTFEARMVYDREFFTQMDALSKWFSLPYPMVGDFRRNQNSFYNLHHRAGFSSNYRDSFNAVCGHLERRLATAP